MKKKNQSHEIYNSIVQKFAATVCNQVGNTVVLHQYQNISNYRIWPNAVRKKNSTGT